MVDRHSWGVQQENVEPGVLAHWSTVCARWVQLALYFIFRSAGTWFPRWKEAGLSPCAHDTWQQLKEETLFFSRNREPSTEYTHFWKWTVMQFAWDGGSINWRHLDRTMYGQLDLMYWFFYHVTSVDFCFSWDRFTVGWRGEIRRSACLTNISRHGVDSGTPHLDRSR